MGKRKMIVVGLILMLALSVIAVGCSNNEGSNNEPDDKPTAQENAEATSKPAPEKVKLRIYAQYTQDSEKAPFDYAKAYMEQEMPNVELEIEIKADQGEKLKTYAATGNMPDLFQTDEATINLLKKSENILQLDDYIDQFNVADQMIESNVDMLLKSKDGHTYAVPMNGAWTSTMFYNKELFETNGVKVPENYEELLAAVEAFDDKGIIPLALFAKEKWINVSFYEAIVARQEPKGLSLLASKEAKASDPAYQEAANKLTELVKEGLLQKGAFSTSYDQALSLFVEGQAAMFFNGGWAMKDLDDKMPGKVGLLYFPFADADQAESVKWNMQGFASPGGLAVSSNTEHPDITAEYAIKFALKFAEGKHVQLGDPPLLKNMPGPEQMTPMQQQYFADSVHFKSITGGVSDPKLNVALEDGVQKLLTGDYAVESFVSEVDRVIESLE